MKLKNEIRTLRSDYELRSFIFSSSSFISTGIFLIYNFVLGVFYGAVWNISISFYYLMLMVLRGLIIFSERKWQHENEDSRNLKRVRLFGIVTKLLILMDLVLAAPIALMVLSQREVYIGAIPAIGVAAYTVYKVTLSILNYKKARKLENLSLFGLKIINLKDAVVSVLTLQNTLIMVFGSAQKMLMLTSYTSAGMLILMIVLTVLLIKRAKKIQKA